MPTELALAIDGGAPVRREPLDFAKGASRLGAEEADALAAVIASRSLFRYKDDLTAGTVADFERATCELLGCEYAIAVSNGTAALRTALAALGVGCGDEVIVPALRSSHRQRRGRGGGYRSSPVTTHCIDPGTSKRRRPIAPLRSSRCNENIACDVDAVRRPHAAGCRSSRTPPKCSARPHGRAGHLGAPARSPPAGENITAGEGGVVTTNGEPCTCAARFQDQGGQFVTSYASARRRAHRAVAGRTCVWGARGRGRVQAPAARHPRRDARQQDAIVGAVGAIDGLTRRRDRS